MYFYQDTYNVFVNIYKGIDLLTFIERTLINIDYLESLLKIVKPDVTTQTEYNNIFKQLMLYRQIIKQSEKFKNIEFRTLYLYQLFKDTTKQYVVYTNPVTKSTIMYINDNNIYLPPPPVIGAKIPPPQPIKIYPLNEIYDDINTLITTSSTYNIKNFNLLLNKLYDYDTFAVSNKEEINKLIKELLLITNKYNSNKLSYIIPKRILSEIKKAYKNDDLPGDVLYKLYVLLSKIQLKTQYIISTKKYF